MQRRRMRAGGEAELGSPGCISRGAPPFTTSNGSSAQLLYLACSSFWAENLRFGVFWRRNSLWPALREQRVAECGSAAGTPGPSSVHLPSLLLLLSLLHPQQHPTVRASGGASFAMPRNSATLTLAGWYPNAGNVDIYFLLPCGLWSVWPEETQYSASSIRRPSLLSCQNHSSDGAVSKDRFCFSSWNTFCIPAW